MTMNGSLTFFETPLDAAYQAATDAQRFAAALGSSQPGPEAIGIGAIAAAAGSIIIAASTIANVVSAAVGIAGLVTDDDNDPILNTLEIEIVNNTSQSIVLFNYVPTRCDVTQVAQPLLPTAADSFVLTSGTVGTFDSGSQCTLSFLIGSSTNTIETDLLFSYASQTAWAATMTIDGVSQPLGSNIQLGGAQFLGNTGFPSFSAYTTPIATPSGKITLAFYSTAAS